MKLSKSNGNMYERVTHMWSPFVGCGHQCSYCHVKNAWRDLPEKTTLQEEPFPILSTGKTIFIGHLCDMFAEGVGKEEVERFYPIVKNGTTNMYSRQRTHKTFGSVEISLKGDALESGSAIKHRRPHPLA